MCDANESDSCGGSSETGNQVYQRFKVTLRQENFNVKCKKCHQNSGFVLLQKKDVFCGPCLAEYCTHKFRSTIGKSRRVKPGDPILVSFGADGVNSVAMVAMIQAGLEQPDQHRRLRFHPVLHYIDQSVLQEEEEEEEDKPDLPENLMISRETFEFIRKSRLECFVTTLQSAFHTDSDDDHPGYIKVNPDDCYEKVKDFLVQSNQTTAATEFRAAYKKLQSFTSRYDFLTRLRTAILVYHARKLQYQKVFVATTGDQLSVDLLNNICLGRGMAAPSEMAFCDPDRYPNILLMRPMRELSRKELIFYLKYREIPVVTSSTLDRMADPSTTRLPIKSSIPRLNEHFLLGLAEEFPSTLYTVYQTGNKIKTAAVAAEEPENDQRCRFCSIRLDLPTSGGGATIGSAFHALHLTSLLSTGGDVPASGTDNDDNVETMATTNYHYQYCYSCLRIRNEMTANEKDSCFERLCRLLGD